MNKKSNYKIDIVSNTTKLNLIKKNDKHKHSNTFKTIQRKNYCPFYIANKNNNYDNYSFEELKVINKKNKFIDKKEYNKISLNKCVNI